MIIKPQANYAKATVIPVHLVSEFTHLFSFTPSSELYEWTNVGNSEWGYRGWFRIQPVFWSFISVTVHTAGRNEEHADEDKLQINSLYFNSNKAGQDIVSRSQTSDWRLKVWNR